ncbi:MAG: HDOD domain-containing protein [Desulfobacterales bacterium]|nr:HDOD domain-containing protein [Desulfobacterales bacterium]MBF0398255.1 HDOD domain-containing protein [Desulfobacterales bacterium]
MYTISVEKLVPGMIIAQDIYDRNGRYILGKSSALTPRHLQIMKIWGILEVQVEGEIDKSDNFKSFTNSPLFKQAEKITKWRFQFTSLKDDVTNELFQVCVKRLSEQIAKGDNEQLIEIKSFMERSSAPKEEKKAKSHTIERRNLIKDKIELPSLPNVFNQLLEVINDPRSSGTKISDIVSKDTSLSTKLLSLANSSFYGFRRKVDTLTDAIIMIGTQQITALAIGISVLNYFKDIPTDLIDMKSFWKHSLCCGITARNIATYKYKTSSNIERLFVGGLIHDIGRLILYKYHPEQSRETLLSTRKDNNLLYNAESEILGIRHTIVGKSLLEKWKIPLSIENIVAYHHNPLSSQEPLEPAIVNIADIIANALRIGSSGENFVPPLDPKVWEYIGLSKNILLSIIKQIDKQLFEIIRLFYQ